MYQYGWIQNTNLRISTRRKNIFKFIVDETLIKVRSNYVWLGVSIEPKNRQILALTISKERNMFVIKRGLYQAW